MATTQDSSVGIGKESTYGTSVTPTRWYEFTDEKIEYKPMRKQGKGLRVGGRLARSGRRVTTALEASGELDLEAVSKGMGLLLEGALGTGTSTVTATAGTYQQNFTIGDTLNSFTVQKGLVQEDGTVTPYTFTGMVVSDWEITSTKDEIVTCKFSFDGSGGFSSATSYTSPSYPTTPSLFTFTQGALTTGTFTAPTTTTLASGATTIANVTEFSIKGDNKLTGGMRAYGSAGKRATKPRAGDRSDGVNGKIKVIYTDTTFRDASYNDTDVSLILTFTSGEALSLGFATLQIAIPVARLEPETPQTNGGEVIETDYSFSVLDGLSATQPLWICLRTADTAL
jgi:hypothetical protein